MTMGSWGALDLARVATPMMVNAVDVVTGVQRLTSYPFVTTQVFCSAIYNDDSDFDIRDDVGPPVDSGALTTL